MFKRIARQAGALTLALCLLLSLGVISAGATSSRFSDVSPVYALAGEIEKAAESGLIGGYPDGTFRPDLPLSRGAFIKMIASAFAAKGYEMPVVAQRYSGVYATYAAFVENRAREVDGYTDGLRDILSSLSEPATRYDAIRIMAAVSEQTITIAGGNVSANQYVSFDDADPTLMALIVRAEGAPGLRNVIAGFADNTVRAGNVLMRAHGVAYAVRYSENRIQPQGEYEETVEITTTNGKTAAELRSSLLGMSFSDSAFAETVAYYMYAAGVTNVSITTTHGGEWNGQKIIRGEAGVILSISVFDGVCESYRAAGRGIIGITAPTRHKTVSDLLEEIEWFFSIRPNPIINPTINVKAYVDDNNIVYFWLNSTPSDLKRVEFAISDTTYTIFSDGEPGELGGYVNVYDSFAGYGVNFGADYVVQWDADENTIFVRENGAIVASAFAYNNDAKEKVTIGTTVYTTSGDVLRLDKIELVIPVYDGDEPESLPGFAAMDVFVEGEDMTVNVYGLQEEAEVVVTTFGGLYGISFGTHRVPVSPTGGNGGVTVHVVLDELEAAISNSHWVSLVNKNGDNLVEPIRVSNEVFLGDYDFPMGAAA